MDKFSRRRAMTIMVAGGAGAALTSLTGGDEVKALGLTTRSILRNSREYRKSSSSLIGKITTAVL